MSGILSAVATGGPPFGAPQLTSREVNHGVEFGNTAQSQITLSVEGVLITTVGESGTTREPQWSGIAAGSDDVGDFYQARLTVSSGTAPSSGASIDTWLDLSTLRQWTLSRSALGSSTGEWLVEIRAKLTTVVYASATFSMVASVSSP